ncbi:uncharacterized protein TM35_000222740 [Trypanosoma theileri]|uniref:Uncharacterized protein n=1 Tax=Trypanosoma theileri TaxID=67003 RepID=A0A1X0NRZ2_9TRYP|nr:uncharacterized protein TM35_000222740 [Trypanosoma theileri]ORC87475.1 hypothetical protein TM35_000222740 [Trypanosoma theileri]
MKTQPHMCPNCGVATTPRVPSPLKTSLDLANTPKEELGRHGAEKVDKQETRPRAVSIIIDKSNNNNNHHHHEGGNKCLRASDSSFPSCKKNGSQMTLTEWRYRVCLDQLEKVSAERDMLKEKVQAMEEQRVLGESTIRELIEENKKLQVAVEQAEVRLGITEIEQQSILAESQQLRVRLTRSLRELEKSRQSSSGVCPTTDKSTPDNSTGKKTQSVGDAGFFSLLLQPREGEQEEVSAKRLFTTIPYSSVSTPTLAQVSPVKIVEKNSLQTLQNTFEETPLLKEGIYDDEKNSLLASNRRLEARCCLLESQLQRLRERFLLQNR